MTRDDVIEIARQADASVYTNRHSLDDPYFTFNVDRLMRFFELVAARECVETEINFCARCGKRLSDAGHIHTCTPPAARKALTSEEMMALHDKLGGKPERPTVNESKLGKRWSETL